MPEIIETDFAKSLGNEVFPTIANNSTDADHDLDIGASTSVWVSNGTLRRSVSCAAMTKQIDAAWSAGDDAGGLDTGTVANTTWYYLYLIYNPTTDVSDYLISTSASSPTLPSGFTYYRFLCDAIAAAVLTDGSANILPGEFIAKTFVFNSAINELSTTSPPTSSTAIIVSVPSIKCFFYGRLDIRNEVAGSIYMLRHFTNNAPAIEILSNTGGTARATGLCEAVGGQIKHFSTAVTSGEYVIFTGGYQVI